MRHDPIRRRLLLAAAATTLLPARAHADDWPNKPLRLFVAHAPGTLPDVFARRIADRLQQSLGQPVVVENRPGAGGTIGATVFAKQPPDGYSIMLGTIAELAVGPGFYDNLSYEPLKHFAPITRLVESAAVLVVNPALGIRSFAELVAKAKANPGTLSCGSFGNGTITHLMALQLSRAAGVEIVHVPYKDAAAALTDVMGGQISMMFNWPTSIGTFVQSGRLVPVLATGTQRVKSLPEVPSAVDVGMPQMVILGWSGFIAPAGIPRSLLDRLNREIVRASQTPEVKGQIEAAGSTLVVGTPEAFAAEIRAEMQRAAALVKATGAKIQ